MNKHQGKYVAGLLRQRGITQAEAAKLANIAPETLNRWLALQEFDESKVKKLTVVMHDLESLMQEFRSPEAGKKPVDEIERLRRENAELRQRLEKEEERAERLLRLLEKAHNNV